ncbi:MULTISPECIES: DUF4381 domain-containing protein [Oleiagrimonas]|uniref:DUF4381 domain-containing protein n=1 Tax=Oleiagrimonas citrea TaxID=1665687 RepID=A0A846ZPP6_9GAMM|nr:MULTISPECIES: DUF4381 domain-containing protein [Oleiagrimonas]NKZ39411.1 DUF4381 domain-containing protein [Oleiagrimonas citrea]RAP59607.1 hypothetical protein BTJ49_02885 [Oleiagrimonas sp. MCCC 1A03011]
MMTPGPTLRDIHPAPPPSWWPPAYGWWLLAVVVLILIAGAVLYMSRRVRRRRRWRMIHDELLALREQYPREGRAWLAAGLSAWLRRAARLHDPRAASLQGEAWDAHIGACAPRGLDTAPLRVLRTALYEREPSFDAEASLAAAERWLRHVVSRRVK